MSADSFDKSIDFVLKWEGGYVHDPNDPGGATNFGISQRSYPALNISTLSETQAKSIYRTDYWQACDCDNLPWPYDIILFDTAVNCGVQQALNWYQNSDNWQDFLLRRVLHYTNLARKVKYQPYLRGWLNRTCNLYEVAA